MDILDKTTVVNREFRNDVRELLGCSSAALADTSIYLVANSPELLYAERQIKALVTDYADFYVAIDAEGYDAQKCLALYVATCAMVALSLWDEIYDPALIREKAPDYEYQINPDLLPRRQEALRTRMRTYLDYLGVEVSEQELVYIIQGSDATTHVRADGV